ncbi:Hypothetical predicted protein [Podarcis lilfordi]|uniref:Uncharacterized protein n=1 Tax=Podarcis lilfordi TaxID=74358 RepID=A0AA35LNI3_9SAUR|nr:Hypothetical predicted protein [Podarcis lilfordi]
MISTGEMLEGLATQRCLTSVTERDLPFNGVTREGAVAWGKNFAPRAWITSLIGPTEISGKKPGAGRRKIKKNKIRERAMPQTPGTC